MHVQNQIAVIPFAERNYPYSDKLAIASCRECLSDTRSPVVFTVKVYMALISQRRGREACAANQSEN